LISIVRAQVDDFAYRIPQNRSGEVTGTGPYFLTWESSYRFTKKAVESLKKLALIDRKVSLVISRITSHSLDENKSIFPKAF
jgi:hypothetical protein